VGRRGSAPVRGGLQARGVRRGRARGRVWKSAEVVRWGVEETGGGGCRMDLPRPTTSVGTRTDYSMGPWDYPACATRHLIA
jgi:hypothetical protein